MTNSELHNVKATDVIVLTGSHARRYFYLVLNVTSDNKTITVMSSVNEYAEQQVGPIDAFLSTTCHIEILQTHDESHHNDE